MGYLSRLYVATKTEIVDESGVAAGMHWGDLIATFNLGKVYNISSVFRQYPVAETYILDRDGNTSIVTDDCGKPITEIPLSDAIDIVKQQYADKPNMRLLWPCLAALEAIREVSFPNEEVVVLHYMY